MKLTDRELKRLLKKRNSKRKKIHFSKIIIPMVIVLNIIFTIAVLYIFSKVGSEPMTLIGAW